MALPRSHPNVLAGPYLERAAQWRKDEQRLRSALEDESTLLVPIWRNRCLVSISGGSFSAHFMSVRSLVGLDSNQAILLGEFRSRACFAVGLPDEVPPELPGEIELHDLRLIAGELPPEEAGLLAYARAMVHWRKHHRYCGRCGAPTFAKQGGHVLECSSADCATQQFPRIDPAVIVLTTDGEHALLGRQASWPPGRYSTIAGFVEPGESLEDAVRREVREETGVEVETVDYHSSQPWPFPSSLMIGFIAHARRQSIELSDGELEDARWVSREEIASGAVALPTTHSIAFRLVEEWYDSGAERPLAEEPRVRMWTTKKRA